VRTLSNVCMLSGIALCLFAVEWTDVRFLADANAEGECYKRTTYYCPGTSVNCPERCINTFTLPLVSWKCRTTSNGSDHRKEVIQSYSDHHIAVAKGASGRSGLKAGVDKPCEKTGTCGCKEPPLEDPNRNYLCSDPSSLVAGPDEVKIRDIDGDSASCTGE